MKKYCPNKTIVIGTCILLLAGTALSSDFADVTVEMGITNLETSALAEWCDVNLDGWVDLYCAGSLWINMQGEAFEEMTNLPGLMSGAGTWGDYDNDGYPDFFNFRNRKLFHNDGGSGFSNVSGILPTIDDMISNGAAWGDFNNSGYLDLYIGGYETADGSATYPDIILMNRGGEFFEKTWEETKYRARGVTACDFDQDNDLDIYVSDYRLQPNVLWINDGSGTFADKASEYNVLGTERTWSGGHTIGSAWGDLDNDGLFDLFCGNFSHRGDYWTGGDGSGIQPESDFFRNLGSASNYYFEDLGTCGVEWQESFASPTLGDFNNDGYLDLYFTTVYSPNKSVLYRNNGDWTFTDRTVYSNIREFIGTTQTYQGAWADFNNDGQLDLVSGGKLMRNNGNTNSWLEVRPVGTGRINSMAIGTQVRLKSGSMIFTRQVESSTGQGNCNSHTLHFGLGKGPVLPLEMTILWPDGTEQKTLVSEVDRILSIEKSIEGPYESALLYETFEVAQGVTNGNVHGQNSWTVDEASGTAVVQSGTVFAGKQALQIEQATAKRYQRADLADMWVRFRAFVSAAPTETPQTPDTNDINILVNTNLHLIVYSNSIPLELDATMPLHQWVTFDIYCNSNTSQWTLSLDGTTVTGNLICTALQKQIKAFEFSSQSSSPIFIDEVEMFDQEPSDTPDSDDDGLPDWWELKYTGSITSASPSTITANGLSFLESYIAGTDPAAEGSFQISRLQNTNGRGISWASQLGRLYDIEWTTNLLSGFACIASNVPSDQAEFIDYGSGSGFYRIKAKLK